MSLILQEYRLNEQTMTVKMRAGSRVIGTRLHGPPLGPPGGAIYIFAEVQPLAPMVDYQVHLIKIGQEIPERDLFDFAGQIKAAAGFIAFLYVAKNGELRLTASDQAHRVKDEPA